MSHLKTISSFMLSCVCLNAAAATTLVDNFVDLADINSSIKIEMRYFSTWNFTGKVVNGYEANKCFLTKQTAVALSKVQNDLQPLGYSLLVFDCYRPQRAVSAFANWSKNANDQKMKKIYYPDEAKDTLFERGYIAEYSGHSRGSTVDLTIIKTDQQNDKPNFYESADDCRKALNIEATTQINMGTYFDCFSEKSNTNNPTISKKTKENRLLLKNVMEKFGFDNYPKEWWHYTLQNEPYKSRYFDLVVQ